MRHLRLSTLLITVYVGLLLLAVGGVALVALGLIQQLADDQALARVEQAGYVARQQIAMTGEAMLTTTQLLSERPTLLRLVGQRDIEGLTAFIAQFQATSQLDGITVLQNEQPLATSGMLPDRQRLSSQAQASTKQAIVQSDDMLLLVAWAPVQTRAGTTVVVVKRLDEQWTQQLSTQLGVSVGLISREVAQRSPANEQTALWARALSDRDVASARLVGQTSYVASVPLLAPAGDTVGLVETRLPTASVTQSLTQLQTRLVLLAVGMGLIGGLASLLIGRRLGRPLGALASAATRIGRGDLSTPIKVASSTEIGTLALVLEEMRGRLLRLTNDLRRQQAEAEAIVTGIVEGVFSVDRERRIRYLNPQAATLLGTTAEAAIGRFCGDVLQPQGLGGVRPCAEQCPIVHARFRGGAQATEALLFPNGERRSVVITSAPAADMLQVQVMRDETEIEATRRLRDAILANISHEFKTPLSAQLASIELLLDQLPELTKEQIAELVLSQQRGTLRLTQLIDNLLESARLEAGQYKIRHRPVVLDEVIEDALEFTRPLFDQRRQTVEIALPYPLPAITGDARRLTQVFVNLLGNAHKWAPADSTISIGGAVAQQAVTVWVQDQGPGLPPESAQRLWSRWVRAAHDEPEQSGVGLGLWLVKSIVERHGGHVDAESNERGTRMSVVLPVEHAA